MVEPRLSVVLVDDSTDLRRLVRSALEASHRFRVVGEAGDGEEAVVLAHEHRPDVMLLDVSMPTMDGLEALPAVREITPSTAVVMYTGFEDLRLAARARQLGATGFVEKSLPLEELPTRLAALAEGARDGQGADRDAEGRGVDGQDVLDQHVASFREVFDQAAIGMATLTTAGGVVRANRALARMFSARPEELIGVEYGELTHGRGDDLDRAVEQVTTGGRDAASFEHALPPTRQRPTGTALVTVSPIRDADRHVLHLLVQVEDVTASRAAAEELRRSEERFRLLVRNVREYAICMVDTAGHVVSWNEGARRINGYRAEEVMGRHIRMFYPPEEQRNGQPERNLATALRDGQLVEEGWRVRQDGTRYWASVVTAPVHDDDGRHLGYAKVTRDRTDRRERDQERRDLISMQSEVLALTAHELRHPAAVIDGSAGLIESAHADRPTEERRLLADIRASARRLHRLAGDLVTASRLHDQSLALELEATPVDDVVRAAAARARNLHPGLDLTVHAPTGVVAVLDAGRLGQSLDNLLDNAVRHGRPPVVLTLDVDDAVVRITVEDSGEGVPAGMVPRLFEMFAHGPGTGETGLGLYLVKQVARRHGGEARYVGADDGHGPRFVLTLPVSV